MTPSKVTMLFAGGVFLPPFEIFTFQTKHPLDLLSAQQEFDTILELKKRNKCSLEGIALLNDLVAAGVYQNLSTDTRIIFVASSVSTEFEVYVNKLTGDSDIDENKMAELINMEMKLQDIRSYSIGQVLQIKDITLAVVQF